MGRCWYESRDYAHSRLVGTVVTLIDCGTPVYVTDTFRDCDDEIMVQYFELADTEGSRFNCPIEGIDMEPVSLGYMNYRGQAIYVTRQPAQRDWKQGFRSNNSLAVYSDGFSVTMDEIPLLELSRTILNDYSKELPSKFDSWAISKEFAVSNNMDVLYKNSSKVGKYVNNTIQLSEEYSWLQEEVNEL